jgi:3-methyl-2-oxobutanoate hydroxymethyltransferase
MSQIKRRSVPSIKMQKSKTPLVCLTAYTTPMARALDEHVDVLLVGDSLGMVVYGMDSTLGVTLSMMAAHGAAVMRGSKNALVVVDMPFGSYLASLDEALSNACKLIAESGCQAVKLEGGAEIAPLIKRLISAGIPVMAHIGLMPQHVHAMGGFKIQGKDSSSAEKILSDAFALEEAGAFAVVLEGIPQKLAAEISQKISIPTIGIGAAPECDGQILVAEDMLGLLPNSPPKFVQNFAKLYPQIENAAKEYAEAVRNRSFPAPEKHCYNVTAE